MDIWERYSYRVFWSEEDQEHVGVCAELSGLSWLDKTPESALRGVRRAAREAIGVLEESGDPAPAPLFDRRYSGVFKVRIPPEVHRRLTLEASEQSVSLNRLVSAKLGAPVAIPAAGEVREAAAPYGTGVRVRKVGAKAAQLDGRQLADDEPRAEKPMRDRYNFSNAKPNPHAKRLKRLAKQ